MLALALVMWVFAIASGEQYCLQCTYAKTVDDCKTRIKCAHTEDCYTEEVVTSSGIYYNAGCRDARMCAQSSSGKRTAHLHVSCFGCCQGGARNDSSLGCNARLCGLPGTSVAGTTTGMSCYSCDHVSDVTHCNTFTTCGRDQVCGVETHAVTVGSGTKRGYNLGCRRKDLCILGTQMILRHRDGSPAVGKRQVHDISICQVCCGDSFCNDADCVELVNKLWDLWKSGHLDFNTLKYIPE